MALLALGLYVLAALLLGTVALGGLTHVLIATAVLAVCLLGLVVRRRRSAAVPSSEAPTDEPVERTPRPRIGCRSDHAEDRELAASARR